MKSRLLYFLISGIIILSVFTGVFIWRNKNVKEIPKFNNKSFSAPISSKYIPTNADLVFHWKVNPNEIPNYIATFQDKVKRNITSKQAISIRDSSLRLIGLDFEKDISKWVGEYGSFALFKTNDLKINDWLMVLEINKNSNLDEETASILGSKLVKNTNSLNDEEILKKPKIITRNIYQNKSIYFLIDTEHILLSSTPRIIESSISNFKKDTLTTKGNYKSMQLKNNLKDGILLLETHPQEIFKALGQIEKVLELNKVKNLLSTISIDKNELVLEGILNYEAKANFPNSSYRHAVININDERKIFNNSILLENPAQFSEPEAIHPYQKLIKSIIKASITSDYNNLFKTIFKNTQGSFIWLKDKEWLILSEKLGTKKNKINDILRQEKFLSSNIEFKNKNLEIWSKVTTNENNPEIKEDIGAVIGEDKDIYIWSNYLSTISNFDNQKYSLDNTDNEYQTVETKDFHEIMNIHLGSEKTAAFLMNFYPYILLKAMLGNKIDFPITSDISVQIPTINFPDFIKIKVNFKTS